MSNMTIDQALRLAFEHHSAGRYAEAEPIYRQILAVAPNHAEALHLLGVLAAQVGQRQAGIDLIRRAIAVAPDEPTYHSNLGNIFNEMGKPDDAIACCRRAVELMPGLAEAHCNLGNAWSAKGQLDKAIACFQRTLELRPDHAKAYNNLGNVWSAKGQFDEAIACFERAMKLQPNYAEVHINLGIAWKDKGQLDEAIACYRRAIGLNPNHAEAHNNLGNVWKAKGRLDEAIDCYRRALALKPDFAEAHNNLGSGLKEKGQLDEAIACYRRALALKPNFVEAHNNLGDVWIDKGRPDEAIVCSQRALQLRPDYAQACNNLGIARNDKGQLDEAIVCYQRALALKPDFAEAYNNLGNAWTAKGQLDEALACYRKALALKPDYAEAHNNVLFALQYHPASDSQTLFEAARQWNGQHARPLRQFIRPHDNDRNPSRRLRVGYVSPDFRSHAVGRFVLPLLASHDHGQFEVFCYTLRAGADTLTEKLRSHADVWRSLVGMTDEAAAQMIRRDQIDILVDLAMHTAGSRPLIFARKPAPLQVTYLAYAGGTGVDAIDYRLTDRQLDPDESNDRFYLEKSFRLDGTYWCYQQSFQTPEVNELPATTNRHITFGCLNTFCKINLGVLEVWSELLRTVADSRLLLICPAGSHQDQVRQFFFDRGISSQRLELFGRLSAEDYFKVYLRMDIALDPFPYTGGTTTCDALWMGVPVVTLAGRTAVGRAGVSILTNLGNPEWIAQTREEYLRIASDLAAGLSRLSDLRKSLRERMPSSALMDATRYARAIEAAYRTMWKTLCEQA